MVNIHSRKLALARALLLMGSLWFCLPAAAGEAGPLLGLQAVADPLPWLDRERRYPAFDRTIRDLKPDQTIAVTSRGRPPMELPIHVRLSRFAYPAEDGHLDAIVRFDLDLDEQPPGQLLVSLVDHNGREISQATIAPIPGPQLHFSYRYPSDMTGERGTLHLVWQRQAGDVEARAAFMIDPSAQPPRSGRVRLSVPNDAGAVLPGAPVTVGVPFPRGALDSADHVRLMDAQGNELPVQVTEVARWSRFGPVKWLHVDCALDLDGAPQEVYLEYGPNVRRSSRPDLGGASSVGTFPAIEAGRLRLGPEGVSFDAAGDGQFIPVLGAEALAGAFVEKLHGVDAAHGRLTAAPRYGMPSNVHFEIEESGPEKVVVRAEGYLVHDASGTRFCRYVNRYVIYRDSPVLRVFHTWIYTGDDKKDLIRNMGWRFPLADLRPAGFLSAFGNGGEWLEGGYLRQHAHDTYTLFAVEDTDPHSRLPEDLGYEPVRPLRELQSGLRVPGVMAAAGDGVRLYIGVQDFWQNFPSSLKAEEDALTFYQWPRYGKPLTTPVMAERYGEAWRLPFAHEGENLSFILPREMTEGRVLFEAGNREQHVAYGRPDSVNAQGIAKTAEMWLYFVPAGNEVAPVEPALQGLHEETVRAVVDPRWLAESGALVEIAAQDKAAWPEYEARYDENVRSPIRQVEAMGVYGKWIYGDLLRAPDFDAGTAGLYRCFRKSHWGWPFSWIPFARSGDAELLRFAQAATRMMTDVGFCHYVSDELADYFQNELPPRSMWVVQQPYRAIGWHPRNLIPWAGHVGTTTRCYVDKADYLWHAWFLTGYHRAKDIALRWAAETRIEDTNNRIMRGPITAAANRDRWPANLMKHYLEMYENTFDPWFLAGAQALADLHDWRYREEGWTGHFWQGAAITYYRYTRCPDFEPFLQAHLEAFTQRSPYAMTNIPHISYAFHRSGHERYARQAAGVLDMMRWALFREAEPAHYRGFCLTTRVANQEHILTTSYLQQYLPLAFGVLAAVPEAMQRPIPYAFTLSIDPADRIAIKKGAGESIPLQTGGAYIVTGPDGEVHAEGRDGKVILAADAPAGIYQIALPGRRRSVELPLTPPDTPEVLIPGREGYVGNGEHFVQHWFKVPEDVEQFWIEFDLPARRQMELLQLMIWGPDGAEVWAYRERPADHDPERDVVRAEITVAPGDGGRLWQLTTPGRPSVPFRMDEQLPRALAHTPERWFDPGD